MNLLITGGTGTLGRAVAREIAARKREFEQIVILSRSEAEQVAMAREPEFSTPHFKFAIGDVTDRDSLYKTLRKFQVTHVVHAAAIKHVPICEEQPSECININVLGSRNVLQAAAEAGVKRVVLVSTDKAAQPGNVYGLSKALMERLMQEYDGLNGMTVNVARFGNLVGSRGSVFEIFLSQIKTSGEVTATDLSMTRFFIRISQAAKTTIYALTCGPSRLVFVPQMKAAKLDTFIRAVFQYAKRQPKIKEIGARPGEKRHELVVSLDEVDRAGEAEEFLGVAIHIKTLPENRRVLKAPISSETARPMDEDEVLSMLEELRPLAV